ncbi:MAG TPA: sugar phosphate isomerase/epimerase family protein [Ktedonobacteraceae bacterium]|jgi:sugar phosphate isomerase/epimerase|nr:sugar phosphate isomerase/epimerase family protein [Ktedonobacteraceae bacterium]
MSLRAHLLCSSGAFSRYPDSIDHRAIQHIGPQLDVDGIEVMFYPQWYTQLDAIIAGLRHSGLRFPVIHGDKAIGVAFGKADATEREQGMTWLEANCKLGNALEAEVVVLHLWGWPELDDHLEQNFEPLHRALDMTSRYGLQLAIETIPCRLHDPLYNVQQAIAYDERSQVTLDTEFLALHNQIETVFAQDWLWEEQRIKHIHIKDFSGAGLSVNGERRYLHPGEGCIDFDAFFARLQTKAFSGTISLESPARDSNGDIDVDKLQRGLDFIRQHMTNMPGAHVE